MPFPRPRPLPLPLSVSLPAGAARHLIAAACLSILAGATAAPVVVEPAPSASSAADAGASPPDVIPEGIATSANPNPPPAAASAPSAAAAQPRPTPPRRAAATARPASMAASAAPRRATSGVEHLVWDRRPLQVTLGVGDAFERLVLFPSTMRIGVPPSIAPSLRIETTGRRSYLTAFAPFPRTRVHAEDAANGTVMLLDLSASSTVQTTGPIEIVAAPVDSEGTASPAPDASQAPPPIDLATLTRFAARQLYAPRRLAVGLPGLHALPVPRAPVEGLYRGALLQATPVGAWRGDDLTVTAVVLRNLQRAAVELDPQAIRGRWRAITFQHGRLLGHGSEADTSAVYLVCERRFEDCL